MKPSIPWSSSVSVFVIERTAIIRFSKRTVLFSLDVPLLSLAVTYYAICFYSLSLFVTCCTTRCHSLSLVVSLVVTPCNSLLLVAIRYHLLSLNVPLCQCTTINQLLRYTNIKESCFIVAKIVERLNYQEGLMASKQSFYVWIDFKTKREISLRMFLGSSTLKDKCSKSLLDISD